MSETPIDVQLLKVKTVSDDRGSFRKLYDESLLEGLSFDMKQMNHVHTKQKFTLRGLHFQHGECAEAKIFRVLSGAIQLGFFHTKDKHSGSVMLDNIDKAYYIPRGYATGYLTLEENTTVLYISDNHYTPTQENGLRPNDPILAINWKSSDYQISDKDKEWPDWK